MILSVWGGAAAVVAASLVLGHALDLAGIRMRGARPAAGLSVLMVIASVTISLPGDAITAAVSLAVVVVAAAVFATRRRRPFAFPVVPVIVTILASIGAAIPFLANGRIGLPGVSLDNDTANHLAFAEGLRSSVTRALYGVPNGYPLGPHSLADALSSGLGIRLDLAFTSVMIATVVLIALTGAQALRREASWRKVVIGVSAGLCYLLAAYYAEGAFKEPIIGLLLLGGVLHLEDIRRGWGGAGLRERRQMLVPPALLTACGIYVYSYPALAFFVPTFVLWQALEIAGALRTLRHWRTWIVDIAVSVGIAVVVLAVLVAPLADRLANFVGTLGTSPSAGGAISASNVGNLAHALSPYEAFGIWTNPDFRFVSVNQFHAGELAAFALAVAVGGLVWSLRRHEFALPAAVMTCAVVWLYSSHGQSSYVTAKALVIAEPVLAVSALRGLLAAPQATWRRSWLRVRFAVAAIFLALIAYSSARALSDEPVWTSESTDELLALDNVTRGQTVLVLAATDYAEWIFHDSQMSALAANSTSLGQAVPRANKLNVPGTALDFDSVSPASLPRFRYVITTNTAYNSQPPSGFRLVRSLALYQLWERSGPLGVHQTIEPAGAPGGVLNCATRQGRAISRQRGIAAVMAPPAIAPVGALPPGQSVQVHLALTPGRWELSLQYTSAVGVTLAAAGRRWNLPPYVDRPGPVFAVGAVAATGTTTVTLTTDKPLPVSGPGLQASISAVIATRLPATRTIVPLKRSCGRYIDWYRTS